MLEVTRTHFSIARSAASAAERCHSLCFPSGPGSFTGHRWGTPWRLIARVQRHHRELARELLRHIRRDEVDLAIFLHLDNGGRCQSNSGSGWTRTKS